MKKSLWMIMVMVLSLCFILPTSSNAAIADGTYEVNYQVNKPGSSSASMANDYFLKPGKLIVSNGKMSMQLTIKNSSWVTEFNPPGGASIISQNDGADQRVVQFTVSNSNITTIAMKIDIDDIDYHHGYSVDFVFDTAGLPEAKAPEQPKQPEQQPEQQPQTPVQQQTQQNVSPGSNTPQNKPVSENTGTTSSNEQSKPATSNDVQEADDSKTAATDTTAIAVTDEEVTTEQTDGQEIDNPETSDSLPLLYVVVFIGAAIVFIRTRKIKTN